MNYWQRARYLHVERIYDILMRTSVRSFGVFSCCEDYKLACFCNGVQVCVRIKQQQVRCDEDEVRVKAPDIFIRR